MNRWSNYLRTAFEALKRIRLVRAHPYAARHRSQPKLETQYSHDVTSTGTLIAVPREKRTPRTLLRTIRHRTTGRTAAKEPALPRFTVGRVSRQTVDLIATLAIAMQMVRYEQLALTGTGPHKFTQT